MKKLLSKISFRFIVQLTIVIILVALAIIHQKFGIEKAAPIDAYCPFGAIESFFTLIFKWEFLQRIFISTFILLWIFLIWTLILGRVFCGYFCPLGAIQEWIRTIWRKIWIKKDIEINEKVDKYLRYLKYIILIIVVYYSFYLWDLIFRNYDPYSSLMHFGEEFEEKIIWYWILGVILISALFSKNWWCRYFCPLGAFFGIIKKISFLKIKRDSKTCISCGMCDKICPANLKIKTADSINDMDCISCSECIETCPKNSLIYTIFNKKISKKTFSILITIIIIVPLIIIPYTPFWQAKPQSNIINTKWEINTKDIRWSNTLEYLIKTTQIPLSEFQQKLWLPAEIDTSLKLKEIWTKYNIKNKNWEILETKDFREIIKEILERK